MSSSTLRDRITLVFVLLVVGTGVLFTAVGNPFSDGEPGPTTPIGSAPLPSTPLGSVQGAERGAARLGITPQATEQLFARYDATFQIMARFGQATDGEIAGQRARCPAAVGAGAAQRSLAEYCELAARAGISLNTFRQLCTSLDMCGAVAKQTGKVLDALASQTRTLAKEIRGELAPGRCRTALLPTHQDVVLWSGLARQVTALSRAAQANDPTGTADALSALERFVRRAGKGQPSTVDANEVMGEIARRCGMEWVPAPGAAAPAAPASGAAA